MELGPRELTDFLSDASSFGVSGNSYQSGGSLADPTSVAQAYSNDPEVAGLTGGFGAVGGSGSGSGDAERANAWESRFGWRVDLMAAAAYLGGPVTGELWAWIALPLIGADNPQHSYCWSSKLRTTTSGFTVRPAFWNTGPGLIRTAYQSALLTTPLLTLFLFFNLVIALPAFLRLLLLLGSLGVTGYTAFRAWRDASQGGLSRFYLPYIGEIAERWVGEEW
jgi:hypothetical protein